MFERFTDRARRAVVLAQEEARILNHSHIGTEHLLLGLMVEGEGVAGKVLTDLGVDLGGTRARIEQITGVGGSSPSGHIPFTIRCKKAMEFSLREALQLGHNYIGTEHVLLGLIREGEGVACSVIVAAGVDLSAVRAAVIHRISDNSVAEQYELSPDRIAVIVTDVLAEPIVRSLITRRVVARLRADGAAT